MHVKLRPYATAGLALVSATAIAATPVVATPSLPEVRAADPAVQLSAAVNPITPWLEVWDNSETNFANLANAWLEAPAPVLQQVIANQLGYLTQLPDFPLILEEMVGNLRAALEAPFATDPSTLENTTPLMNHRSLFNILSDLAAEGAGPIPAALMPLVNFSTTYTSGMLLGLVGPVVSPILALVASAGAIVENLTGETPDLQAAFNTLINTPAVMADAFLNGGQTLDLTPVLDALGIDLDPAPGTDIQRVGITFGGLLSPGGSVFNALGFDIVIGGRIAVPVPGQGPGFVGSLIGLTQAIAKAIGWDGTGNPLAPPPEAPATQRAYVDDPAQVPSSLLASRTITLPTAQDEPLGSGPTEVQTAASSEETTDEEETTAEEETLPEEETEVDEQETEVAEDLGDDLLEQEDDEPTGNQYGVVRTNGPDNQTDDDETAADEQSGSAGSGNASKSEAGDNDAADATSSESSETSSDSNE